jgi:hypothetical protein
MLHAAAEKGAGGWLDVRRLAVRTHLLNSMYAAGRPPSLSSEILSVQSRWAWELADWLTVTLEASFLLAALRLRSFRVVLALACFFHLANTLLFRISFYANIVAYGMFVNWAGVRSLSTKCEGAFRALSPRAVTLLGLTAAVVYGVAGNPFDVLGGRRPASVACGALVAAIWLVRDSVCFSFDRTSATALRVIRTRRVF